MIANILLAAGAISLPLVNAQVSKYQPCPLLGEYLPPPHIDASSSTVQSAFEDFTDLLERYIAAGDGDYGPISPNTTSFSVALFAGSNYVPKEGDETPFFYEYHHAADAAGNSPLDASSTFAIGDLTQMFTALTVLLEGGDEAWSKSIVDFIPELKSAGNGSSSIDDVQWEDVTLGALASHLGGIARDSNACQIDEDCPKDVFLQKLAAKPPVELPDTTPVFSHAAFQLLAFAVESRRGKAFSDVLAEQIAKPLQLKSTALLGSDISTFSDGITNVSLNGEPASLGLVSSIFDLSLFGRALLTSDLLDASQLRRWLQPVSSTSNLRNAVGRPWEVYHYSNASTDPIIDVYTKSGTVGRYSSYFGLAPSADVGFAILAVDSETQSPDLNASADLVLQALVQIQALGYLETNETIVGTYHTQGNATLSLQLTGSDPGIAVTTLSSNGTNWLETIAGEAGIEKPEYLDLRIYPTGLEEPLSSGGKRQVFQGVIQDRNALVDAGTPTCISWQTVGEVMLNGAAADRFVLSFDGDGVVSEVHWQAGGATFKR